jgi:hypothetical protein
MAAITKHDKVPNMTNWRKLIVTNLLACVGTYKHTSLPGCSTHAAYPLAVQVFNHMQRTLWQYKAVAEVAAEARCTIPVEDPWSPDTSAPSSAPDTQQLCNTVQYLQLHFELTCNSLHHFRCTTLHCELTALLQTVAIQH